MLVLALLACRPLEGDGPVALYNPDGEAIFDAPWPTDLRRVDGGLDFTGWPNPYAIPAIDDYLTIGASLEGFGTNAPIYVRFDGPLDTERLPTAAESLDPESPVYIVNVDARSDGFGERIPVQWAFNEDATSYRPANLLAVAPVYGFPLRPATTYALVVTTDIAKRPADFDRAWDPDDAWHGSMGALADASLFLGIDRDRIAVATTFTTQDPLDEMASISHFVREDLDPPVLSSPVFKIDGNLYLDIYAADYPSPVFTYGDRPYTDKGGGFQFAEDGTPLVASWDDMRLAICTPKDISTPPPGGWPVVIQQHGTGGSWISHCSSAYALEVAAQLGVAGFVSLGIDQPLHGTRIGDNPASDLDHFNFLNAESGRANFRQGAVDAIYLAHALHTTDVTFTTPDGTAIPLDRDRVYFLGHSQGGLTGALALPFFDGDIDAAVLSGAGGGLSMTVIERKDPIDIQALVHTLLQLDDDEVLDELHPITGLIQTLVEVTDPLNTAPYWFAERGDFDQEPTDVLLFSGFYDAQTPHDTSEALAVAARLPQLVPAGNTPDGFALRGLDALSGPIALDSKAYDDSRVTAAFSQWPDADHYAIFTDLHAAGVYRRFLRTAADGEPVVEHVTGNPAVP